MPKAIQLVNRNITQSANIGSDVGTHFKDHVFSIPPNGPFVVRRILTQPWEPPSPGVHIIFPVVLTLI